MKLQALDRLTMRCRDLDGNERNGAERGDVFLAENEDDARHLVEHGLARPVGAAKAAAKNKAAQSPLAGGPTGGGKPSSSSGPDRAPPKSRSASPKAARKPSS